jgi:hypothetical protein
MVMLRRKLGTGLALSALIGLFGCTMLAGLDDEFRLREKEEETCTDCVQRVYYGTCAHEVSLCNENVDCASYDSCVSTCYQQTEDIEVCDSSCTASYPDGAAIYDTLVLGCLCYECPSCGC